MFRGVDKKVAAYSPFSRDMKMRVIEETKFKPGLIIYEDWPPESSFQDFYMRLCAEKASQSRSSAWKIDLRILCGKTSLPDELKSNAIVELKIGRLELYAVVLNVSGKNVPVTVTKLPECEDYMPTVVQ
jgi:hypothetical protein